MSSKNTPTNTRVNKVPASNVSGSNSSALFKHVTRRNFNKSGSQNITADKSINESVHNTAFSSNCSSASRTPSFSAKSRPKTPNGCFTPSSLYKNLKSSSSSTPTRLTAKTLEFNTPKSGGKCSDSGTPEYFSKVSLETPTPKRAIKSTGYEHRSMKDTEASNLKVAVRVRPLNAQECLNPSVTNIIQVEGNELTVIAGTTADCSAGVRHNFQYDNAFWSVNSDDQHYASQEYVFRSIGLPLVDKAFEGYNACLFAYGQTGSGKSFSMTGIETDDNDLDPKSEAGIIPRFCKELFRRINSLKSSTEVEVEVSYFEIYNEKIHDLLCVSQLETGASSNPNKKSALRVREHPVWGPYVVDLSTHPVDSYAALKNWLTVGNSQRATAATGMNDKSSRSHSIFNIVMNLSEIDEDCQGVSKKIKHTKRSKISLVDLAGSERISHGNSSGDRVREGVSINKSLLTLGKVIASLADSKKLTNAFVPYRESVLTFLLRESLGGNSRTVMLATISPASLHVDETLSTLRYACQARTIINRVKVNEDPHDRIIRELRAEVERLQGLRQDYERQKRHSANGGQPRKIIIETSVDDTEVEALRVELTAMEKELAKAEKSWMERLKEAENSRKSEMRLLRRKGLAMELSAEHKQVCLINLAADPILSGTLFYIIPQGKVRIGRTRPSAFSQPDIILDGPLVAFNHCCIDNIDDQLYVTVENTDFETFINGDLLVGRRQLYHGDRLVIGGSHYFRVSNPNCPNRRTSIVVDYELAHKEILQKQEAQLRCELEEEKQAALNEIELERIENERNYREQVELLELEKFKYNCSKELLETEKKALADRINADEPFQYTPYKSTLLDDIKRIMQHPTEESLHKTQLKVKEATHRSRELGCQYEFKQSQVVDEFGIFRAVVVIIDKDNQRKAEWPTARLDVWLDRIRETDVTADDIFKSFDLDWVSLSESLNETINDSLNSSRISLNLAAVRDVVLKQKPTTDNFQKFCNIFKSSTTSIKDTPDKGGRNGILNSISNHSLENVKKGVINDEEDSCTPSKCSPSINAHSFTTSANMYLKDIQKCTIKLKKLCDRYNADENVGERNPPLGQIQKSIDQMEEIIYDLKTLLTQRSESTSRTPKSVRFLLD